eukprot:TRINITY_DN4552_c0_g1_i1.p1 TRINITY_DN4552_c0_g1~~TRINITY_DN4552_c0_g1_i1.p1  ORF type:complete len:440 (-),score=134.49 TRINITY_DN4552_c0_g1_i1:60-1379(-)
MSKQRFASNKDKEPKIKPEEEIPIVKKKLARTTEQHKELEKKYEITTIQLNDTKIELSRIRKLLDESKIENDGAERAKTELDIQYRHLLEIKKDHDKEIRELQAKNALLRDALHDIEQKKKDFLVQKEKDIATIEHEKNHLNVQARFSGRKLEDDRRALQSKLTEAKIELKRNFRHEVDALKQKYELSISEKERESKTEISSLEQKLSKKIESLEQENYQLHAKLEFLRSTVSKQDDEIETLEKNLKRETLNSEVTGSNHLDEIHMDQYTQPEENEQVKNANRKIEEFRTKIIHANEDLLLVKRQKQAAEKQVKELKQELEEQEILYRRLEAAKNDSDRRLIKRIEQIEEQIERKTQQLEADQNIVKNRLQATLEDRDSEIQSLRKELGELQGRFKVSTQSFGKVAGKLTEKADNERHRYNAFQKDKHDYTTQVSRTFY